MTAITWGMDRQWNLDCLRRGRQIIHKLLQLESFCSALLSGPTFPADRIFNNLSAGSSSKKSCLNMALVSFIP